MLQAMEKRGYLISHEDSEGRLGRRRKVYTATPEGRRGLAVARERLRELTGEISHAVSDLRAGSFADKKSSQRRQA
jgi:PadR family transcriptional regulator, regulatory protein PadR